MKLFNRFSRRAKIMLGTSLAVVTALAVAIPAQTGALLGADREVKAFTQGVTGFDHVQFNSFTGVPDIGDERNFFTGKISGAAGGFYDPMNNVKSGDELLVRVYVHNNADSSMNANGTGIAKNTKVRVALPTGIAQNQSASAFISADNAQPAVIEDTLSLTAATPIGLTYVPGSATVKSHTGTMDVPLSDSVVTTGATIGSESLNGEFQGCFEHVATVTFKVKVTAPEYSLIKNVRVNGGTTFTEEVSVKPGDKVDFNLGFKNTGGTNLDNVVIGDRLPVGLTYVPGTTRWISGHTGGQWTPITNDNWLKGGLDLGGYGPNGTVLLQFTAVVANADQLECGVNTLVNHGFAMPKNQGMIEDSATVKVTKECATPTPTYSCDLLDLTKDNNRTVTVKNTDGFKYTATNGATFKNVVITWGDGTETMTDAPNGKTHQYAKDGTYTIKAVPHFSVTGSDQDLTPADNVACSKVVTFTTPVTPAAATTPAAPTELPNTGVGNVAALFAAVAIIGTVAHRLFLSRKFAR